MKKMTESNSRPRIVGKRNKAYIPLSRLQMSDAVKVVSDFPRRMEELLHMLEDRDRLIRGRAAATLAHLVSVHPARLTRSLARLREALLDESAYVRWHTAYTIGTLCALYPKRLKVFLTDLIDRLEDQNTIVRMIATKALARMAYQNPGIIEEIFRTSDKEAQGILAKALGDFGSNIKNRKD